MRSANANRCQGVLLRWEAPQTVACRCAQPTGVHSGGLIQARPRATDEFRHFSPADDLSCLPSLIIGTLPASKITFPARRPRKTAASPRSATSAKAARAVAARTRVCAGGGTSVRFIASRPSARSARAPQPHHRSQRRRVRELQVRRIVEIHVRLRDTVDQQGPAARPGRIGPRSGRPMVDHDVHGSASVAERSHPGDPAQIPAHRRRGVRRDAEPPGSAP